jgi:hypothetical protein
VWAVTYLIPDLSVGPSDYAHTLAEMRI